MKKATMKRIMAMVLTLVLTASDLGMGNTVLAAVSDDADIISGDIISDDAVSLTDTGRGV